MRTRIQIGLLLLSTSVLALLTGCSPGYTTASGTATNQVAGVFGFVLGENFTNRVDWTQDKDGGYSYSSSSYDPDDKKLPQLAEGKAQTVMAFADESGRIYRIHIDVHLDDGYDLFKALRKALAEKYPEYGKAVFSRSASDFGKVSFGNKQRRVDLMLSQKMDYVSVDYEDEELWTAYYQRTGQKERAATDAAVRHALDGTPDPAAEAKKAREAAEQNTQEARAANEAAEMLRKQTAEQSDHDVDFEVKWAKKGIPRTWTYKTGQKVDGEWTTDHVRAGCIFIRTDDGYDAEFNKKFKYYGLDISKLCEQDQKIATKLLTGR